MSIFTSYYGRKTKKAQKKMIDNVVKSYTKKMSKETGLPSMALWRQSAEKRKKYETRLKSKGLM